MTSLTNLQKNRLKNFYLNRNELIKLNSSKLSKFLEDKWFPRYRTWDSCWANIWEALLDFGIEWLPHSWRDWYKWTEILDKNKNFIKVALTNPSNAYPWWILVYNNWYSNNDMRKKYGHVEIKTNIWYWYGGKQKLKAWWGIVDWFIWYAYYLK